MIPLMLVVLAAAPDLTKPMTLELRDVSADKFFEVVSTAMNAPVRVTAPVGNKKVTVKLINAPMANVLDVVTGRLGLRYRQENGALIVEALDAPGTVTAAATAAMTQCPSPNGDEVVALRQRVSELEATIVALRQQAAAPPEEPAIPMPADLPPRLRDANLMQRTFNAAFREAGFTKGDVSTVDCSEFPCIVHGKGFGGPDDMAKLERTGAFEAFVKDQKFVWGWRHSRDAGSEDRTFSVAVLPEGTSRSSALSSRLDNRVNQYRDQNH